MLFERLSELYDLALPDAIQGDQRGAVNQTLFVGDDFVLTIFRNRTFEQVELIGAITQQDDSNLLPQPIQSKNGLVSEIDGKPAILWKRIHGSHYVGTDHSDKLPLSDIGHQEVASAFWRLHSSLSKHSNEADRLGVMDYGSFMIEAQDKVKIAALPDFMHRGFVLDYLASEPLPQKYPALVHTDMERHNILHDTSGHVTGIVDVDAIMSGDLLFEYAHVMMNYLFTDPDYAPSKADWYIEAMMDAGRIQSKDFILLPKVIRSFAAEDLFYYLHNDVSRKTDLERLSQIYEVGVQRMDSYFADLRLSHRPAVRRSAPTSFPET
jgi:Ser/Thr protein kinase RdoA (MazF antagonist)